MKKNHMRLARNVLRIAGGSVLLAAAVVPRAEAADEPSPLALELIRPASVIELGAGYVTQGSFKFGEYNGLSDKGLFAIGNLDVRGGAPYDRADTYRWRITGTDLGLETRNIGVDVGRQGNWRLRYSYDELRREFSDSYQTFYEGAGSTRLSIPAFNDVPISARLSSTATANGALANWQNIQSPYATAACAAIGGVPSAACAGPGYRIPAAMHDFDVSTKRKKHDVDWTQELTPDLQLKFAYKHEDKEGDKLTGVAFGGPARGVLVPEPIQFSTDIFRASIGWHGAQSQFTVGYIGSLFHNDTNTWLVENPFNGNLLNPEFFNFAHMNGAPDNQMHQLHLDGSYAFSPTTRLVVTGNYQRMTQDEAFGATPSSWTVPEGSPHARVVNTNFTATLTARPTKQLDLTAQYKYEDRDNQTSSRNFIVAGGDAAGAPSLFTNRPLDFRTNQFNLDADYKLASRQAIRFGYEWKEVKRTVNATPPPPAEQESPFPADRTTENTVLAEYRNTVSQRWNGRLLYAYSQRRSSEFEEGDLLPAVTVPPFPAADAALPGFKPFFVAPRDRNKVRGTLNYQATDQLGFGTRVEYMHDNFPDSQYGLQKVESVALNLDTAYSYNERTSYNAFYTYEDRKSNVSSLVIGRGNSTTILDRPAFTNPCTGYFAAAGHLPSDLGTDPCRQWMQEQADRVHTVGVAAKWLGLGSDRFDLDANLTYSYARTPISVTGGAYFGNGSTAPAPAFNNIFIGAENLPDVTTQYLQLRLDGVYALDKVSAIRLVYIFGHLKTNDWQWDAYANSPLGVLAVPTYPGPMITSPDYNVSVFGISYIYRFR